MATITKTVATELGHGDRILHEGAEADIEHVTKVAGGKLFLELNVGSDLVNAVINETDLIDKLG